MTTTTNPHADLYVYPGDREPRCPHQPPQQYGAWLRQDGLPRVRLADGGKEVWMVARYDEIKQVLADPRFSASSENPDLPISFSIPHPTFPRMDDPEHARLRRMLTADFSVKRVETYRPEITRTVEDVLEQFATGPNPADLMEGYALPIPSKVIAYLLGVPYGSHKLIQENSAKSSSLTLPEDEKAAAAQTLFRYVVEEVHRKLDDPGDDLLSRQAEAVRRGEITVEDAAMNANTLLVAGHRTTSNMITLSTLVLLQYPEQLARIRDTEDPAVVRNAVEELLRFITIAETSVVRAALEDVEIGGQLIRKGDGVIVCLPAGNRDAAFAGADDVDVDRNTRGHISFGYGIHQCLGQNLARAELQVALPALLRRLPGLHLDGPIEDVRMRLGNLGVDHLQVAW